MKRFINNFEEIISGIALTLVLFIVIFNVLARYFFSMSFNWAEEIAAIGFAWCVFVGASACYKRGMHIGIDILFKFLPVRIARFVSLGTGALLVVSNIYLTYLSLVFSISAWIKPTAVLLIPYTFVDISATVGFSLMSVHSIRNFINELKGKKEVSSEKEQLILDI